MSELVTIAGIIKWTNYQQDDNKFKVAKFCAFGAHDYITIVGYFKIELSDDMTLTLTGRHVHHEVHGDQFEVHSYDIGNTLVKHEKPIEKTGKKQLSIFEI